MKAIRVLLAEYLPVVARGLTCLLEEAPDIAVVGEARNGEQALQLAREQVPDVLLLDVKLPDLSAAELIERLHETQPSVRVLLLLSRAERRQTAELLAVGAAGAVTKREEPKAVFEAVRAVGRGDEVWLSPRVASKLMRQGVGVSKIGPLTKREWEVLERAALGQYNAEIAEALGITEGTVRNHLSRIYRKLGVYSRAGAVAWAWRSGRVGGSGRA